MNTPSRPRVLFAGGGTGGHLYPALALAEAFQAREGGADVYFVGARRGVEARVLPERGVPHELLRLEPIRRTQIWRNWRLVPALGSVIWRLPRVISRFKPDLIVGTGGYASGPVVAYGILRGIPTAVQEQNSYPGITTRWLSSRVSQLHLAFPEALEHLAPGAATEVFELGNPIRPPDRSIEKAEARDRFNLGDGPVVLVVGGSQGAKSINDALLRDLKARADNGVPSPSVQILWATGPNHHDQISTDLEGLDVADWVHAVPYIHDMTSALAAADVAVSRAGAMALAELCAWGIPSILVPFPHAAANHQFHNAKAVADAGAAIMKTEEELAEVGLLEDAIALAADEPRRMQIGARARERGHPDAAREIAEQLSTLVPPKLGGTG